MDDTTGTVRLGLRENLAQFSLLVLINAFVGGMVGLERTVVPLIGTQEFAIGSEVVVFSFIITFGLIKACVNVVWGLLVARSTMKTALVCGWCACQSRSCSRTDRPGPGSSAQMCSLASVKGSRGR